MTFLANDQFQQYVKNIFA